MSKTKPRSALIVPVAVLVLAGPAVEAGGPGAAAAGPTPTGDSAALDRGRRLTGWLLAGEVDSIADRMAPGAGRVVTAVDTVAENEPGRMNREVPPGNHVVIDHGNGEFSLLAHFRRGSLEVGEGDRVEAGQRLGECVNSGNSSEPHVHHHLQDGPGFGDAAGLPAQLRGYRADDGEVERGEPVRGQLVRQEEE